jgi:hypothetical protein
MSIAGATLVKMEAWYSQVTNSRVFRTAEIYGAFNVFTVGMIVEQLETLFATARIVCLGANIQAGSDINDGVRSLRCRCWDVEWVALIILKKWGRGSGVAPDPVRNESLIFKTLFACLTFSSSFATWHLDSTTRLRVLRRLPLAQLLY